MQSHANPYIKYIYTYFHCYFFLVLSIVHEQKYRNERRFFCRPYRKSCNIIHIFHGFKLLIHANTEMVLLCNEMKINFLLCLYAIFNVEFPFFSNIFEECYECLKTEINTAFMRRMLYLSF